MSCSFITGLGIVACFFAPNLLFLNIFFGVVHGVTMSGVFVGTNVVVAQHFKKRRTTACSVVFTLCGFNMLVAPPIVEYFLSHYGLRGTFLLLGALTANAFPAAIVLRSPPWSLPPKTPVEAKGTANELIPRKPVAPVELASPSPVKPSLPTVANGYSARLSPLVAKAHIKRESWTGSMESFGIRTDHTLGTSESAAKPHHGVPSLRDTLKNFLKLAFCVDALSFAVVLFGYSTFVLLSVDLAKDRGIPPSEAVYLLHAFCAGDIIFRAISGYVIDSGLASLEATMLSGYLVQAAVFEAMVWSTTLATLLLCSFVVGASNGFRIGLQAPIMVHDFGVDVLPIMMGGLTFVIGSVALGRPALIGYYRDNLGKYDGLLHIIAVGNVVFLAVWVIRLFLRKRTCRKAFAIPAVDKPSVRV